MAMSGNQENEEIEALLERHYTVPAPTEQFAKALEDRVRREQSRLTRDRQGDTVDVSSGARERHAFGSHGRRGLRRGVLWVTGVAACLAGVIAVPAALRYTRDLPRDQVLAAIQQARAMHVVSLQQFDDGSWREQELVYRRGGPLVEVRYLDGRSNVLVDDGRSAWEYASGDLLRGPTYGSVVRTATLAKAVGTEWISPSLSREASADRSIHGDWCKAYRTTGRGGTWRVRVWIDESNHVRRCETSRLRGRAWMPVRIAQVYYGTPTGGFRLFGDADASPEILDTAKPLKSRFDLKKAMFTRPLGETVFAVHEVTRCEDGLVLLVCSARSTESDWEEGAADTGGEPCRSSIADRLTVTFDWQPSDTSARQAVPLVPWELRRANHDGLQLAWYILKPQPSASTAGAGDIDSGCLRVRATMEPAESTGRAPGDGSFEMVMRLPPATKVVPLAHVVARVYSDALVTGALSDASQAQTGRAAPSGVGVPLSFAMPAWLAGPRLEHRHGPSLAGVAGN